MNEKIKHSIIIVIITLLITSAGWNIFYYIQGSYARTELNRITEQLRSEIERNRELEQHYSQLETELSGELERLKSDNRGLRETAGQLRERIANDQGQIETLQYTIDRLKQQAGREGAIFAESIQLIREIRNDLENYASE